MERTKRLLFLLGVVTVAFNLRPAIVSVAPLLEQIRADVALSYSVVSLLTTVPTLLMGLFAFVAPAVARRTGRARATFYAVAVLFVGLASRVWAAEAAVLLGSTLLVGLGIGVGQAYLPALVRSYYAHRAEVATGLYSTAMIAGAGLAAGSTVPIRDLLGAWPLALAGWAVPAGVGLLAWAGFLAVGGENRDSADSTATAASGRTIPWRAPTAWLTVLYFGGQASVFYAVITWLPAYYVATGLSPARAGLVLFVMFAVMPVTTLGLSNLAERVTSRRLPHLVALGSLLAGLLLLLAVPRMAPFGWAALVGLGLGGVFALALILPVDHAASDGATQRLTSMTFGVGYLLAAAGPVGFGVLLDAVGDFSLGFAVLIAAVVGLLAIAVTFTPDRVGAVA
jgi:CP family cyanate transporter-like MFS transporter